MSAAHMATRFAPLSVGKVRLIMPDSREALLRDCVQIAEQLKELCPQQGLTSRLVGYLTALSTIISVESTPLQLRESYAHIRSLYEASIEFLKKHQNEEITEQKLMDGLSAGNAFQSELPGFQRRLRQALNNKKRSDIERIGRGGDPANDIIRLRPANITQLKKR